MKRMKAEVVVLTILTLTGVLLLSGCYTYRSPATGDEAHYAWETLRTELDARIGAVYAAAKRAADELHLRPTRSVQDGISAEITALNARRDQVEIELGALPDGRTEVAIRVGTFGDREKSIVLLERILENLGQQVATAPAGR